MRYCSLSMALWLQCSWSCFLSFFKTMGSWWRHVLWPLRLLQQGASQSQTSQTGPWSAYLSTNTSPRHQYAGTKWCTRLIGSKMSWIPGRKMKSQTFLFRALLFRLSRCPLKVATIGFWIWCRSLSTSTDIEQTAYIRALLHRPRNAWFTMPFATW